MYRAAATIPLPTQHEKCGANGKVFWARNGSPSNFNPISEDRRYISDSSQIECDALQLRLRVMPIKRRLEKELHSP